MKQIYTGKTKDVYLLDDGNYLLKMKDDATGKDGVFDPGENAVGLTIEGLGRASLRMSAYYFEKLAAAGIPTHYVSSDLDDSSMTVKPAEMFGKGVEMVCRYRAVGSFYRRYSDYVENGAELGGFVEFTLKNDELADPPITKDALEILNIMTPAEYEACKALSLSIGEIIKADLQQKGLELYDIKFEYGRIDGLVSLIDEISAGNMRVFKGEQWLQPLELSEYFKEQN